MTGEVDSITNEYVLLLQALKKKTVYACTSPVSTEIYGY